MKIWKMKDCFYSDVVKELNDLEKKHAIIRQITQTSNKSWFTIFYTVEDDNDDEV